MLDSVLARQVLYLLSHAPVLFSLIIFQIGPHVYVWLAGIAVLSTLLP
jgi:hypothetical protein